MSEWFKTWFDTTYYDILYDDRDELEAEEFIQHLLIVVPGGMLWL